MAEDNLHSGHRDRLRQRLMTFGADALCEHELLELILFYALPRVNTNDIAHCLVNRFGTINNILNAPQSELESVRGVGGSTAEFIRLMRDMCADYEALPPEAEKLPDTESLCRYFTGYFSGTAVDLCLLLSLSSDLSVIGRSSFSAASIMNGNSEIKRIAASLLRSGCSRIALGIVHPDRPPVPDEDDFTIARFIAERLEPIGIFLEDCVICGGGKAFSMKQSGAFSFRRY